MLSFSGLEINLNRGRMLVKRKAELDELLENPEVANLLKMQAL